MKTVRLKRFIHQLGHGIDFDGRQGGGDFFHSLPQGGGDGRGIGEGAHFVSRSGLLPDGVEQRNVNARRGFLAQIAVFGIGNDSDYDHFGGIAGIGVAHMLAERSGIGEKPANERLIDDRGADAAYGVLRLDFTAHQQGNPDGREVLGADMVEAGFQLHLRALACSLRPKRDRRNRSG